MTTESERKNRPTGCLKQKKKQAQGEIPCLQDSKPRLISALPRNVTSNQSVWNFLINTSEVICPTRLCHLSPKERFSRLKQTFLFFSFANNFVMPVSAYKKKPSILCNFSQLPSICYMGC